MTGEDVARIAFLCTRDLKGDYKVVKGRRGVEHNKQPVCNDTRIYVDGILDCRP
jgi:hypothetical protein